MDENFNIEIVSPEKKLFAEKGKSITIPSFEGEMTILYDHISIITFLRPGIININENKKKYFVEEGTVEFSKNNLTILSSTIIDLESLSKDLISSMLEDSKKELNQENLDDKKSFYATGPVISVSSKKASVINVMPSPKLLYDNLEFISLLSFSNLRSFGDK